MLRMQSETGWWLVTHPDHARLAGAFAAAWGNDSFRRPEPREQVLYGIASHDDGWAVRDAHPVVTRQGRPSAFSCELVGKYSAFEEIDIADYLEVRDRAVRIIAEKDPYAGLLISMHTYNLLSKHADRSTIAPDGLELLDSFLDQQRSYQSGLLAAIEADQRLTANEKAMETIEKHFRLLQACDNLSLLTCVSFDRPASLLHPLAMNDGSSSEVGVIPLGQRHFRLTPWPFEDSELSFTFPARHVSGETFESSAKLESAFYASTPEQLSVRLSA